MTKQTILALAVALGFGGTISASFADHDDWYKKYDHDHDGHWNYDEYARAQREWQAAHHQRVWSDDEMRRYYDQHDRDKDGYWAAEEARRAHHW